MSQLSFEGVGSFSIDPDKLLARLPLKGNELVLLTGTIVQGIGNATSDYDLYVISDERPLANTGTRHPDDLIVDGRLSYVVGSLTPDGPSFDADFLTFDDVGDIAEAFRAAYFESIRHLRPPQTHLTGEPEDFVNSLRYAIPILNTERMAQIVTHFAPIERLDFIKYHELSATHSQFEDVIGAWQVGDHPTCLHILGDLIVTQVIALGQLVGAPSFKRKWLIHILKVIAVKHRDLAGRIDRWLATGLSIQGSGHLIESGVALLEDILQCGRRHLQESTHPFAPDDVRKIGMSTTKLTDCISTLRRLCFFARAYGGVGPTLLQLLEYRTVAELPSRDVLFRS